MSGGAQFFKRRSTETGAAIRDTDQEQAGTVVQKIRSSIRGSLLLYHNSSSTTASNHIMPQNISSIEDIASAALFTSQGEQNGKPYPTHVLPSPITINKEALATCSSWSTFVPITESAAQRSIRRRDQLDNGCCRLPSIPHGADHRGHGLDESLDPNCPDFGRKGIVMEVLNTFCKCCFLVSSSVVLISSFLCIVLFSLSATILIFVDIWFVLLLCNDVFQFCWLLHCMLSEISSLYVELNPQVKERQKLEGCKARLYVRPVAFDMYEGIFHNDGPLDWNPGCVCTQHRMYASPSDTWRLTSVGGIHWPPRWVLKCSKYAAAIPPMLNGFCSPCGNDFLERFCLQCYEQAMFA